MLIVLKFMRLFLTYTVSKGVIQHTVVLHPENKGGQTKFTLGDNYEHSASVTFFVVVKRNVNILT